MTRPYYSQHWVEVEPERHQAYEQILTFHPAMEPLLAPLDLRRGLRVLDVGCGPGHTTVELARRIQPEGRLTAVDVNEQFLEAATQRVAQAGLAAAVDFRKAAFPPLPFDDGVFDRVWCKNVLEYVDDAAIMAAEMARVAAPGALVVATDSDWDMIVLEVGGERAQRHSDRMLAAARSIAVKEPRIGRRLCRLFKGAGLGDIKLKVLSGADRKGLTRTILAASFARYAVDSGSATAEDVARWMEDIDQAIRTGDYLFIMPQFVASGRRLAAAEAPR